MEKQLLEYSGEGFRLCGKAFNLRSGEIQYFRIYPTDWHRHFKLAKDFGLNTIQTYVPWNLHEPEKGKFNFEGNLDLCAFLDMAKEYGLKVLLRPSPFICAECEFGGLPVWLHFDKEVEIRCSNAAYLKHIREYYNVLIPKIVPYLSTNGGPIIMVGIENEYGGNGYDRKYLQALYDMLVDLGIDVPCYTTDNSIPALHMGSLPGMLIGCNFRSLRGKAEKFADYMNKMFPDFPFFVGELWAGAAAFWGMKVTKRDPQEAADAYAECLSKGCVNFYMFSGGTNFGFFSGALRTVDEIDGLGTTTTKYKAYITSYDTDALVRDNGLPTEKYYKCREVLDKALGREIRMDRTLPFKYKVQTLSIKLDKAARFFDNLDVLVTKDCEDVVPKTMEELGQQRGFVLYSTEIEGWPQAGKGLIVSEGVNDRATFYDNETYIGKVERDCSGEPIYMDITNRVTTLNILTEGMGRITSRKNIDIDRKGITRYVLLENAKLYHWHMRSIPMDNISDVHYQNLDDMEIIPNDPVFYRGTFDAEAGVETFLDMKGWGKGFVVINGFNIGRFWEIGPQYTLYVPGGLLKDKGNVIEIFDVSPKGKKVCLKTVKKHNF